MTEAKPPFYKRRSTHITLALVVTLFVITLVLIPHAIEYSVKQWILTNGHNRVSVEDVDFNPFSGELLIHKLSAERMNTNPLAVEEARLHFSWHPLWKRQIALDGISLRGADIHINVDDSGEIRVGGISSTSKEPDVVSDNTEVPWGIAINDMELQDIRIQYISPALSSNLQINKLRLSDLASFLPDQAVALALDGQIDGADIMFEGKLKPFADTFNLNGQLKVDQVQLDKYQPLLPESITLLQGNTSTNSEIGLQFSSQGFYKGRINGDIQLNDLSVHTSSSQINLESAHWLGEANTSSEGTNEDIMLTVNGKTGLTNVRISQEKKINLHQAELKWDGTADIRIAAQNQIKINANGAI